MKMMGILNVTPDSFFDGGRHNRLSEALDRALEMEREGASLVDVGGESTRPGYQEISPEEEMERVLPVIEKLRGLTPLTISIDTYKPAVALEAVKAGASMVNDIHGLREEGMAEVVASAKVSCVVMHFRKECFSEAVGENANKHAGFRACFLKEMEESLEIAERAGIQKEKIILDPGIGFGKTKEQELFLLGKLELLKGFGCKTLLGVSRKSVIGFATGLPKEERLEGSLAACAEAFFAGYDYIRVHDVKAHKRFLQMLEAVRSEAS